MVKRILNLIMVCTVLFVTSAANAQQVEPAVQTQGSVKEHKWERGDGVVGQVLVGGIVAGVMTLPMISHAVSRQTCDEPGCSNSIATPIALSAASALLTATTVYTIGAGSGGDGSFLITALSSSFGGLILFAASTGDNASTFLMGAALTVVGSTIGYQFSASESIQLTPTITPTDGGLQAGIGLRW